VAAGAVRQRHRLGEPVHGARGELVHLARRAACWPVPVPREQGRQLQGRCVCARQPHAHPLLYLELQPGLHGMGQGSAARSKSLARHAAAPPPPCDHARTMTDGHTVKVFRSSVVPAADPDILRFPPQAAVGMRPPSCRRSPATTTPRPSARPAARASRASAAPTSSRRAARLPVSLTASPILRTSGTVRPRASTRPCDALLLCAIGVLASV